MGMRASREMATQASCHQPHQALGYRTPTEVFHGDQTVREEESKDRRCSDGPVLGSYVGVTGPSLNSALILSN